MRLDQLNGLLALSKVAEKRSFSAAALELRVSPSALSQSVRALERRLGVALLSRTTRRTSLTEAGRSFLERCDPALKEILSSVDMVAHYAARPSGLLRLTFPRIAFGELVQPVIASFMRKHPEVSLELYMADEFTDIIAEGFDAGIRAADVISRDMTTVRLSKPFRYVISGSPSYFAKHGRPKHPKDLLAHDCIRYRFADGDVYQSFEFEHDRKEFTVEVSGRLIVNEPIAAIDGAVQGLGLLYYGETALTSLFKAGKLEPVLLPYAARTDGYHLYFPSRSQVQPKLRAFIEHLREHVKGQKL